MGRSTKRKEIKTCSIEEEKDFILEKLRSEIQNELYKKFPTKTSWCDMYRTSSFRQRTTIEIARCLAEYHWGEIQQEHLLAPSVFEFTTGGHGGYIVDTDVYHELKSYNTFVPISQGGRMSPSEQHFAAFEEDAAWSVAAWILPDLVLGLYSEDAKKRHATFAIFRAWLLNHARNTLEWHDPKLLLQYPEPVAVRKSQVAADRQLVLS